MNTFLAIAGALGGVAVFATAVFAIIKAIARQVSAVKANEKATKDNTAALSTFSSKLEHMDTVMAQHGERIARLEGRT